MIIGLYDGIVVRLHYFFATHYRIDRGAGRQGNIFDRPADDARITFGTVRDRLDCFGSGHVAMSAP